MPAVIGLQDSHVCLAVRTVSVLSCITLCMCTVLRSAVAQQVARTYRTFDVGVFMVASCIARCGQCFCMVSSGLWQQIQCLAVDKAWGCAGGVVGGGLASRFLLFARI